MVVGDEAALVGSVGVPVVPDRCGQGEQSLGDSGEHPVGGASAVAFQAQLAFEGVVDGLDPLPDPAQAAVAEGFVASVGAMSLRLTVSREVPQGSGVASISRRSSHHDGLTRATWLIAAASSGAAARSRLW